MWNIHKDVDGKALEQHGWPTLITNWSCNSLSGNSLRIGLGSRRKKLILGSSNCVILISEKEFPWCFFGIGIAFYMNLNLIKNPSIKQTVVIASELLQPDTQVVELFILVLNNLLTS